MTLNRRAIAITTLTFCACFFATKSFAVTPVPPVANDTKKFKRAPPLNVKKGAIIQPRPNAINADPDKWVAPKFGDFTLQAAFKSRLTAGRRYELETIGGKNFKWKNEFFLGAVHKSGWGLMASDAIVNLSYADTNKDVHDMGDPTLIFEHPNLYANGPTVISGYLRVYLPGSPYSVDHRTVQTAYYSFFDTKLAWGLSLSNALIPRYFAQSSYAPDDANMYVEDSTELSKKILPWLSIGIGHESQIEQHDKTPTGTSVDIYPFLVFTPHPNILIEPLIYLPAYINNSVGGAASSAALDNSQAELFFQMSL